MRSRTGASIIALSEEAGVAATGKRFWISWVLSVLPSLVFLMSAGMKIKGGPESEQAFAHLGLPTSLRIPLAVLELSCVAIYLTPPTAVLGAILLAGYLGGAILTHLRIGEPVLIRIAIGVFVWLGLYLREDRLRALLPVRKRTGLGSNRDSPSDKG